MRFNNVIVLSFLMTAVTLTGMREFQDKDYLDYHRRITTAEELIAKNDFKEALNTYDEVFKRFDFIFLRDYKVAAQLAFYTQETQKGFLYLEKGIASGWELNELKKQEFFLSLQNGAEWRALEKAYDSLHHLYEERLDSETRAIVREMFNKDQKKAMGALLRIGDKAQEKYAIRKFAPHSEEQMIKLTEILDTKGYPGEKLIGNDFWMSTILSHHNSITREYVEKDTMYTRIRPILLEAIRKGEMSPYEFAMVEDWRIAVASDRTEPGYGFLNPPVDATLASTNTLRANIGMRSIELRNELVDIEETTGMDLYLPDWVEGKISVEP